MRVTLSDETSSTPAWSSSPQGCARATSWPARPGLADRRARRRAHRPILCHKRFQHLRDRRGGRDRGPLLRPGRAGVHQRRGGGRPASGWRGGIPRGRHVHQAQAARRRRRQLRRRDGCDPGLPRGRRQRRGQPDLRQAGALRRRQDPARRHPGRRRLRLRRAAPDGRRAAARRSARADRAGRIRRWRSATGRRRTAGGAQICSCNNVTKGDLTDAIAGGCATCPP